MSELVFSLEGWHWADLLSGSRLGASVQQGTSGAVGMVGGCGLAFKPDLGMSYRQRVHPSFVMVYILRGQGQYVDSQKNVYAVRAGHVICMSPHELHSVVQQADGQWAECFISLHQDFYQLLVESTTLDLTRPVIDVGVDRSVIGDFQAVYECLTRSVGQTPSQVFFLAHQLLFHMTQRIQQQSLGDPQARAIEATRQLLTRNLNQPVDYHLLAKHCDLSYEHFRKRFKQLVGMSPGQYRIHQRIDRAQALLAQGGKSIKKIAYELGYSDPFTFSRQFKKVQGISPRTFQQTLYARQD